MQAWAERSLSTWLCGLMLLIFSTHAYAVSKPIRALHFVVFHLSVGDAKRLINVASKERFNTIILGLPWRNGLILNSTPWVVPDELTWSRKDLLEVVKYARQRNMEVIPQLPLLSQQQNLLAPAYPDLMFNARTYDPRNDRVYELVFPVIDEIIELIHPAVIHIGHDEVVGWKQKHFERGLLRPGEEILPADLFLKDVDSIHAYIKSKGIEVWMWGDMLIDPDEFPNLQNAGDINGSFPGYGQKLRRNIPKDIVICDWHYLGKQAAFPSVVAFHADGFRVLGATWRAHDTISNFSQYAAKNGAIGMISTTWIVFGGKEKSKVVLNNWDDIEAVISDSGAAFNIDFPDAKR